MDFSVTASEIGTLITYVAPGYLMQLGYRTKFPAPERSAGTLLIISVVLSLPLVAVADALTKRLHISDRPLAVGFALSVTVGAFILGYAVAAIREAKWIRRALAFFDYWAAPESSIYAQTLMKIAGAAEVEVWTVDGTHLRGAPTIGPLAKDDGIDELHLSNVTSDKTGEWAKDENWASVIIPLNQVSFIALVRDLVHQGEWKTYKDYLGKLKREKKSPDDQGTQPQAEIPAEAGA